MEYLFYGLGLLLNLIALLYGIIFVKKPVTNINSLVGFRTKATSYSKESWDYAQKIWAKLTLSFSFYSIIIYLIIVLINVIYPAFITDFKLYMVMIGLVFMLISLIGPAIIAQIKVVNFNKNAPQYYEVEYQIGSLYRECISFDKFKNDIMVANNLVDIEDLGIAEHDYNHEFFKSKCLVLIKMKIFEDGVMTNFENVVEDNKHNLYFIFNFNKLKTSRAKEILYTVELNKSKHNDYTKKSIIIKNNCPKNILLKYTEFNGIINPRLK